MKGFNKIKVKAAASEKNTFDLSRSHQTTLDFGQVIPIFHSPLIPGDRFTVDFSLFSRLAPMVVPTFGKASVKTKSFFVPYRTVADDADAFFGGDPYYRGFSTHCRFIKVRSLQGLFTNQAAPNGVFTFKKKYNSE